MKNKFTKNNFRIIVGMAFMLFFLSSAFFVRAQQLIDTLNWSTSYRNALVASSQNSLYIGGISSIGKARGPQAFFLNGSTEPDAGMPFFTDERQMNSRNVYTFVGDGSGGWYVGGNFISVNGEKTGPLVHIRSDKSLEVPFVNNLSFSHYDGPYVSVIKKSGDFLYVGGDFTATDGAGNKYRSLFRVNLATKTVDASFNPFSFSGDTTLYQVLVKEIEITGNKIFVSGQFGFDMPKGSKSILVFNTNTGKMLHFYNGIGHIKLIGDTLLFTSNNYLGIGLPLAWSNNGGNTATLDTLVDSIAQNVLEGSYFIYSVPDGRGGWFVAGAPTAGLDAKQGIFHLDRNLQIDTAFKQFHIIPTDFYGNLVISQMVVAGNSLFVAFNGTTEVDGVKISGIVKLDTATGKIDKSFHPNPSSGPNFWKVYSLTAKGDTLFVAGHFDSIAGQKQPNLAALRCSTGAFIDWHPAVQPLNFWDGSIRQMKIKNDTLYAAGNFKVPGTPDINYMARFDLKTGSVDTTFHIDAFTGKYMHITGMAIWENKFFINGDFSLDAQGKKISNLAYVDLNEKTVHPVLENCRIDIDNYHTPQLAAYDGKIYAWGQSLTGSADFITRPHLFSFYAGSGRLTSWSPNPSDITTFSVSDGKLLLSGSEFSYLKSYYINNAEVYFGAINTHTFRFIPFYAPGHKAPPAPDGSISCNEKYVFGKMNVAYGDSLVHGVLRLRRKRLTYAPFHYHIKNTATVDQVTVGTNGLYLRMPNLINGYNREKVLLLQPDSGTLLNWQPVLPEASIDNIVVSGKDVLLRSDYNLLWPAYTRWGEAKIDLTTGKLSSDWMPEFKGTECCVMPYVPDMKKMLLSGDTLFVLFDEQASLNGVDTGNLFALSPATGQIISGFKPPRFPDGYMTIPARSFAYQKGTLFVIGDFTEINGKKHNYIAKINSATGEVEPWNPKLASGGSLYDVAVYKDTVYVTGYRIAVTGDSNVYDLVSIDGKTGKIIKKYKHSFKFWDGSFQKIAVDQSGTVMLVPQAMFDTVCMLKPETRNTLVRVPKLLGKGNKYTAIRPFGKNFVLAVSHMKEQGKATTKPGFLWYNPQRDTVFYSFSIPVTGGDNAVTSMAFFNNMMVVAGDLNNVFGHPEIKNLAFIKLSNIRLKPGITSWSPHKADNRNPFAVNIYGYGFNDSTSVELYSGDTAVQPDSLTYTNYKMVAWFDGTRFSVGDWNIKVKISDSLTKDYSKAIHIYRGTYADMWAKWVGPKVVLVHKPETYYVTYGNKGNSDAFGVFLYLAVSEHQKIIFPDSLHVPHIKYQNFSLDADTMSRYINVDDFFGKPFHGKVYTLFIPYMPANTENAIKLFIRSDVHGETPEMRLAISQPLYDSYGEMMDHLKSVGGSLTKCLYDIVGNVAQLNPAGGCVKSVVDNIIIEKYNLTQAGKSGGFWFWTKQTALVALDCAGVAEIKAAYKTAKEITLWLVNGHSTIKDCQDFYHQVHGNNANAVVHASVDPNDKYGPTGMHSSHFVRSDIPYHYLITFENDSNATAPAERVVIKDTLDQTDFDLNTFKALGFGFGDTTYLYREQDKDTVYIDLRPAKNTIVRVFYHLDKSSGVLTWTFQSLDPSTYEYVSDPSDGFLPPNKKAPEGDGNVLYSIRPLSGLSQGTLISNTAHIVFDWNDEMATKAWINKTDNTAPESAVNALPSTETDKDFTVSWDGSDESSGIYSYTVYVSENDSAYYPWIIDTHDTSAVFSGTFGSTYKFYTVATDSAGNVEAIPGIYDAMTRLSGTGIETFGQGNKMQFRLYPNPATDRLNLDCYLPQSSEVRIDLMNVCGHLVKEPITLNGTRGIHKSSVDVSTLPAGTYFVRILTKYGSQIRKVVVQ